jgi:hypothetical protein
MTNLGLNKQIDHDVHTHGHIPHRSHFISNEDILIEEINKFSDIDEIKFNNFELLPLALRSTKSNDPYVISPTYHALTGRRGLWLYKDIDAQGKQTFCLFCLHPNLLNAIIIYPAFGNNETQIVSTLISKLGTLNANLQIGRVQEQSPLLSIAEKTKRALLSVEEEKVLDWLYPAHTIDCTSLVERKGKDYGRIRQTMNKFNKRCDTEIRLIDFKKDYATIRSICDVWEDNSTHYDNYDITETDYFERLFNLANKFPYLGLKGLIVSVDGIDKGFSIWELSQSTNKIANLFASQISDTNLTNLMTYLTVESAKYMLEDGAKYMCLGGSENAGMDRYKRGFIPAYSTALKTLRVKHIEKPETLPLPAKKKGEQKNRILVSKAS